MAEGYNQHIAVSRAAGVHGLYGGYAMVNPVVVYNGCVHGVGQGKAANLFVAEIVDGCFPLRHVFPPYHHHKNPVHAITVQSFRRGAANGIGPCLNTELVYFRVPCVGPALCGGQVRYHAQGQPQYGHECRVLAKGGEYGFKPAFHPPIKGIVIPALVMGLVWFARYRALGQRERGIAPAPVAPAIGHVAVHAQIVPACGKILPPL